MFEDYFNTLKLLKEHLTEDGIIIVNDAYANDSNDFQDSDILTLQEILKQIKQVKMKLIDEFVAKPTNSTIEFENLKKNDVLN